MTQRPGDSDSSPQDFDDAKGGRFFNWLVSLQQSGKPLPSREEIAGRFPEVPIEEIESCITFLRKWPEAVGRNPGGPPFAESSQLPCIEGYRTIECLGEGGMGVVFLCEEKELQRKVCLKLLKSQMLVHPEACKRFEREIKALARLSHRGIVRIFQSGMCGPIPYFTMEYVKGDTLNDVIRSHAETGGFNVSRSTYVRRCVEDIRFVSTAIHHAHENDIVHRDIKPSNLIYDGERLRVLDFGLAHDVEGSTLTQSGARLGTPAYMPPEQLDGKPVVRPTDVYSLGITLYEMLTLRRPFSSESEGKLAHLIKLRPPPSPRSVNRAISRDLEAVIEKALAKEARHRYDTAEAFAEDLTDVLEGKPVKGRRIGPLRRSLRLIWWKRGAFAAFMGLATLLLLILLLGWLGLRHVVARQARRDRVQATIDLCGDLPDDPSPSQETVKELIRLCGVTSGSERGPLLRALSALKSAQARYEDALRLYEQSQAEGGDDLNDEPWRFYYANLLLRCAAPDAAGQRLWKARTIMERLATADGDGAAHASAFLRIERALAGRWEWAPIGERVLIEAACQWQPRQNEPPMIIVAAGERFKCKLYAIDNLRTEPKVIAVEGFDEPLRFQVFHLIAADLDGNADDELWAICAANTQNNCHELSIWRIVPHGTVFRGTCAYRYEVPEGSEGYRPYVLSNACCNAALPICSEDSVVPGLLVGTYNADRTLSYFVWDAGEGTLRRHLFYSTPSDIDSLAVAPPLPGNALPQLVVNYGLHKDCETCVLHFDRDVGHYLPVWRRPLGVMRQCCLLRDVDGKPAARVFLGNGGDLYLPAVFGTRNPGGVHKGFYVLDLCGGTTQLRMLKPHPAGILRLPRSAACGHVAGLTVCLTVNAATRAAQSDQRADVQLIAFPPGHDPVSFALPALRAHDALPNVGMFTDLDGDGSNEIFLLGKRLRYYGPQKD